MSAIEKFAWSDASSSLAALIRIDDPEKWTRIVKEFRDHNYRQEGAYGLESAERNNARVERMAIRVGTDLIGAAAVRLKSIPFLKTGMAYIGGGPLTHRNHASDENALAICLSALRREYIDHRGYTLRILPPLDPSGGFDGVADQWHAAGFEDGPWPPPYRTIIVDIRRPLPEIRRTLAQKWRNCLNNAEKRGMTIRGGNEPEMFEQFNLIFEQFMDRKHISVDMGADFYRDMRTRPGGHEGYYVCIAYVDGVPMSGQLVSMLGDTAVTILAATGEAGLKCKASNLIQWHAIEEAHRRGMHWFDPGGVNPEMQPGVYHFKQGLGGREVTNPGPFQLSPTGMIASVTPALEKLYRWSRRLHLIA